MLLLIEAIAFAALGVILGALTNDRATGTICGVLMIQTLGILKVAIDLGRRIDARK